MKKIILATLMLFSLSFIKAQEALKCVNSQGTFLVKNLGTGNWNYAKEQAQKIGYRLPSGDEFDAIMKKTPGNQLFNAGFDRLDGRYYWTSIDDGKSWAESAKKTNALVIWWGSGQTVDGYKSPDYKLMEKTFGSLGIVAVKKIK